MRFQTKDWSTQKETKIRASCAREMNIPAPASDADISNLLDDYLRRICRRWDKVDTYASADASVQDI